MRSGVYFQERSFEAAERCRRTIFRSSWESPRAEREHTISQFSKIFHSQDSYVVVVGVGGVGSHCAVNLARSGVGRLRIVDFDQISLSSLNRHAAATWQDVGTQKVECLKTYIQKFNPYCKVEAVQALFAAKLAEELLLGDGRPDFVVDCIDNLNTKCDLIEFCCQRSLPILMSGGSAAKADPTKVRINTLSNTVECELSRAVRQQLRERAKARKNCESTTNEEDVVDCCDTVMVVSSVERTARGLMPLKEHQEDDAQAYAPLQNFRVRVLPV